MSGTGGKKKKNDLTGQKFGKLTVIRRAGLEKNRVIWECRCDCGNTAYTTTGRLRKGISQNCGCEKIPGRRMRNDLTGQRFGNLTAIRPTGRTNSTGILMWECRCDCGNIIEVGSSSLKRGNNKSCGCLKIKSQRMVRDRLHIIDGTCVEWVNGRKQRFDNKTGHAGVFMRKNGRFSATIGFKKKIYSLGTYDTYVEALDARVWAEDEIHKGFVRSYEAWKEKAGEDPSWAQANPFIFNVEKINGKLVVQKSI